MLMNYGFVPRQEAPNCNFVTVRGYRIQRIGNIITWDKENIPLNVHADQIVSDAISKLKDNRNCKSKEVCALRSYTIEYLENVLKTIIAKKTRKAGREEL